MEIPADTPNQSQESTEIPEALPEPGPYEDYVRGLLPHWPHLRIVTDFMSVDLKDTPTPFAKRMFKTDVRVIDIVSEAKSDWHRANYTEVTSENLSFGDLAQFQQFLEKPRKEGSRTVSVRLIMVEDLSAKLIETLGSKFNIDPDFFAQHLGEWSRHYKGFCSNSSERAGFVPYPLKTNVRKQEFHHFTFQRAYEWQEEEWIKKTNLENSNLWRPHISRGIKPEVFVNERFSAFSLRNGDGRTGAYLWIWALLGIYLFDPLPQLLTPRLYGGMQNFRRKPPFLAPPHQTTAYARESSQRPFQPDDSIFPFPLGAGPPRYSYKSLRDEAADSIVSMGNSQLEGLRDRFYECRPIELPLQVILSSWGLVANILNRKIEELEEMEEHVAVGDGGSSASNLNIPVRFVTLRKHARRFAEDLERTLFNVKSFSGDVKINRAELQEDAEQLISEFTKMAARGNFSTPKLHVRGSVRAVPEVFVRDETLIQEEVLTQEEAFVRVETVKQLAMLVGVFLLVPVTLIATVLGIWPWMKYWIFVGLSLPTLVLTYLLSKEFKGLRLHLTWDRIEKKPVVWQPPPVTLSDKRGEPEISRFPGNHLDTSE